MNPHSIRQTAYARAGEDPSGAGGETAGTITQAKQAITSTARDTAARIKSVASDTANRAKSEAQRIASDTKETTASRLGGYGSAIHESAKSFEEQDPNIAWATHRLADRVEGVAQYIRSSDLADLKSDAENFARRHPLAFFGGLLIGGLVIGNLLKAHDTEMMPDDDFAGESADSGNPSGSEDIPESPLAGGI